MVDGLLNGWVGNMMDKSFCCMGKEIYFSLNKSVILSSAVAPFEIEGKTSLEVFGRFSG
jgi:hypothetical protein